MAAERNGVTPPSGPLAGIRVLDFSSFIAGCYATLLLGDMGAEVIKVEPLWGDLAREWGPFLKGESRFFQGWNRNKRSIALDLKSEQSREIIYELARRADVVVENFRPGVTEKLKIDYATLSAINPRLIYCSSTAFGPRGPYRDRPGYDPILQSMSGAADANVRYTGGLGICSVAVSDYQAAMLCASGICAALYHRERTGEGQRVETSLLQSAISCQAQNFIQALETPEEGVRGIYPYRLFETKDHHIFIAGPTDKFWQIFTESIGLGELGRDAKYATNRLRVLNAEELTAKIQPRMKEKTTQEWLDAMLPKGMPCAPVQTWEQFFDDPQVAAMNMMPVIEHATIGPMRVGGVPVTFEKTPGAIQRAAPLLGEHGEEILKELGYDESKISDFKNRGVISQPAAIQA